MNTPTHTVQTLVNAEGLLKELFPDENSRPSLRWLRMQQKARTVPYVKWGRLLASEFEKLSPAVRMSFMKSGGRLQDDPAKPKPSHKAQEQLEVEARAQAERATRTMFRGDGATMRRADFERLTAAEQMQFFKNNGRLTD